MRITKQQADENRRKVVDTAEKLFRQKGFDGVAVADLMRAAGMSHGGFYNHFDSKAELEAEAVGLGCARSARYVGKIAALAEPQERRKAADAFVEGYLSAEMRDAATLRCAMVAFGGDMPRQSPEARAAFAKGLDTYFDNFAAALAGPDGGSDRPEAIRTFAAMVGALLLARATVGVDDKLSDEILESVRESLLGRA